MSDVSDKLRVCMVAPFPPRRGGVTVQTALLVRYLEQEGVEVVKVDTNLSSLRIRGLGPLRLVLQPWVVLFRLLRSVPKCDVVHFQSASYWGYMPTLIGVPIARLFRKRTVLSYQGGMGPRFMDRFGWFAKMPFRVATVATVCSLQLQDAFAKRGIRTELLSNLFDAGLFRFRDREKIEPKLVWTRSMEEVYDPLAALSWCGSATRTRRL
jgi:glycosyltransferase involved in cell wall biosynthesis